MFHHLSMENNKDYKFKKFKKAKKVKYHYQNKIQNYQRKINQ